jgi:hypothetical protein
MTLPRPLIKNWKVAVVGGLVLFAAGAILLHDAYEGRGRKPPGILRPFTFW